MADTILTSREIDAWVDPGGLSDEFLEIMSQPDTDDGIIMLLDISHPDLDASIKLSSNPNQFLRFHPETREPVHGLIFQDVEYIWCAFTFILVNDPETGAMGGASIMIENIDPIMTETIREIALAPRFDIALLRKNDTSRLEMLIDYLMLVNVTVTYSTIKGDLTDYSYLAEPVPPLKYTLANFPGLS